MHKPLIVLFITFMLAACGRSDSDSATTVPGPQTPEQPVDSDTAPTAAFSDRIYSSRLALRIIVDASDSHDPNGGLLVSYHWDWGDGSPAEEHVVPEVLHQYKRNGTYPITLTVTDSDGEQGSLIREVVVHDGIERIVDPDAFDVQVRQRAVRLELTKAEEDYPSTWFTIDWGDGSSTAIYSYLSPFVSTYVYQDLGEYQITLIPHVNQKRLAYIQTINVTERGLGHLDLQMVQLNGGEFIMGTTMDDNYSSLPSHTVTISPFAISAYELSERNLAFLLDWALEKDIIKFRPDKDGYEDYGWYLYEGKYILDKDMTEVEILHPIDGYQSFEPPAFHLSWYGAMLYCALLNQYHELDQAVNLADWSIDVHAAGYRPPTESEWEYAARGGLNGALYPWGEEEADETKAWYEQIPGVLRPKPSGAYPPNGYGLYDMAGNASEWCFDVYKYVEQDAPRVDPIGSYAGEYQVLRGGCYTSYETQIRCASREFMKAQPERQLGMGLRPVFGGYMASSNQ